MKMSLSSKKGVIKYPLVLVMFILSVGVFGQEKSGIVSNLAARMGDVMKNNKDTAEFWVRCIHCSDCPSAAVYIDGKAGNLNNLNPDDIERVRIIRDTAVINGILYHGIVIVETKAKDTPVNSRIVDQGGVVVKATLKSHANSETDTAPIIGVWKFVSTTPGSTLEITKIITKEHFVCVHILNKSIVSSFGGTYSFDGVTYTENVKFGTQNRNNIGWTVSFKIRFDETKLYLSGTGDFREVWERVE